MAYIFDKINQQLEGQSQNQNIFGGQGLAPQPGGQGQQGGAPEVKTSTEGADVGGGASGGSTQGGENLPQEQAKQSAAVIKRNVGKVSNPGFTQKIASDLSASEQGLQNEANSYVQKAQNTKYDANPDDYGKLVSGDKDAYTNISGLLGKNAQAEADSYAAFKPETNYQLDDVENLRSGSGVGELLRREAGGSLSQREVDLDRSVLERSPEFIKIRNQLLGQQSALSDSAKKLQESETAKARTSVSGNLTAAQEAARAGVGSQEAQIRQAIEAKVAEENAKREALRKGGNKDFVQTQSAEQIQALKDALANDPNGAYKYIDQALGGVDASQFYGVGGDVGYEDLIDQGSADKFNIINRILGKGDIVQAGGGVNAAENFNSGDFAAQVKAAAQSKDADANARAQSDIDTIMRSIQDQANQENQRRKEGYYDNEIFSGRGGVIDELKAQYGADRVDKLIRPASGSFLDYNQFAQRAGDVSADDFLDQGLIDRLSKNYEELSAVGPQYKAGAGVSAGSRGSFDAAAYKNALLSILQPSASKGDMGIQDKLVAGSQDTFGKGGAVDQVTTTGAKALGIKKPSAKWKR